MRFIYSSFFLLSIIYVAVGGYQYKKLLSESIQVIQEDIGFDLATAQMLSAQKKVETLKKFGFVDLKLVDRTQNNIPKFMSTIIPLKIDGLLVGYITDYPSFMTLTNFVIGTTYLGIVFAIVFLLVLVCIVFPLERYKKKVQHFIKAGEITIPFDLATSYDEVTHEIYKILNKNLSYLNQINKLNYEIREQEAIASLALQVAHDIRSPLSVLKLLVPSLPKHHTVEKCDLLLQSTKRIEEISESLLKKGHPGSQSSTTKIWTSDLKKLILEKKFEIQKKYSNLKIEMQAFDEEKIFNSRISKLDLERIISNLLNNAAEAFEENDKGIIKIDFSPTENFTHLTIQDNGKGMEKSILDKVGTKGFSAGKKTGNGLGAYYAKSTIESSGGMFKVNSVPGQGTTIAVSI